MSKEKGQVLHSLQELDGVGLVPLPELPDVELGDLAKLEAQAEKIRETADQIQTWIRSTLRQLELVEGASREARELMATQIAKTREDLANLLHHEIPAYRRTAWLGLLGHEFSRELMSRAEVGELLTRLVKEGRLVEDTTGDLRAYGKTYAISPDSCFGEPEVAEARRLLAVLLSRVFQETGRAREEKAQELRAQGFSDLQELLAGKPGKYAVEVPAEKVIQNGQEFWRGGGVLLVERNEQDIKPLDASGAIEGAIEEARKMGVFLKAYTIAWDKPPVVPGLDPERGKKVQLLWHLLKRTIRCEEEAERVSRAKEELAAKATITSQEFFLECKPGICLVEFQGTWQNPDGSAGPNNLFCLIERKEEEGVKRIRIAEAPDLLGDFFAPCVEKEFTEEENKFEGIAQPLRAVLQAIYGQVLKASKDANKADQIANE